MEEKFMKEALKEAKKAYNKLEVPVGAVIVKNGKIIARGYNQKETKTDTTKHAEIIAIQKASKKLKIGPAAIIEIRAQTFFSARLCALSVISSASGSTIPLSSPSIRQEPPKGIHLREYRVPL